MSQLQLFQSDPLPWQNQAFLCVDTETTGLDKTQDRVIEVAWVMFQNQTEQFSQARLCSIDNALPSEITKLTGISDSMLQGQSPFAAHADDLINAMSKAEFIVAYNADFDRLFLEAEMARIGKKMPTLSWIDPCTFIREIDRYQKGKKLSDASARWGIELKDAHRAMADAKATGLLLYKLAPRLKPKTLTELVKMQETWRIEQDRSFKAYLARKQTT